MNNGQYQSFAGTKQLKVLKVESLACNNRPFGRNNFINKETYNLLLPH